jgi:hypothetical protein
MYMLGYEILSRTDSFYSAARKGDFARVALDLNVEVHVMLEIHFKLKFKISAL